jgi:hypothetical protein
MILPPPDLPMTKETPPPTINPFYIQLIQTRTSMHAPSTLFFGCEIILKGETA